ncbi:MAG: S8 family serine peptidase, partial [Phyllobacterium sp.]
MLKRYVVLPPYGFRSEAIASMACLQMAAPGDAESKPAPSARQQGLSDRIEVLDAVSANGPRLVAMSPETELALRREDPALKIVPVVEYHTMKLMHRVQRETARTLPETLLAVEDSQGRPVAGARIIAFTSYRSRTGDEALSGDDGRARLRIAPGTVLERIYIYGPPQFWGFFARSFPLEAGAAIRLSGIDLSDEALALSRFRQKLPLQAGTGIVVGIVDTGIARDHPLLPNAQGGANMVLDEIRDHPERVDDWGPADIDGDHGTHVAGIIGARPLPAIALAGVAPGVVLRSYRVFAHGGGGATHYDIMNAI